MKARVVAIAVTCAAGCVASDGPIINHQPIGPLYISSPPPAVRATTAPRGTRLITATPFNVQPLTRTADPGYAAGRLRRIATLHPQHPVSVWGTFDAAHRIVLAGPRPTGNRPRAYELLDSTTLTKIADLDDVYFRRLSDHELVVDRGNRELAVDVADGKVTAPQPRLPDGASVTSTRLLWDPASAHVWLAATSGLRTFVGPWQDRALAPTLADEIPTPYADAGFDSRPIGDGIELGFADLGSNRKAPCPTLRLHDHAPPECLQPSTSMPQIETAFTAGWDVEVVDAAAPYVVATERATAARQRLDLPCRTAMLLAAAARTPRVLVSCHTDRPDAQLLFAWTPAATHVFTSPGEHGNAGEHNLDARAVSVNSFQELVGPVDDTWLDLERGVALTGPDLVDFTLDRGARFVALEGSGATAHAVAVDADARTVREVAALPCQGEVFAQSPTPRLTILQCGVAPDPKLFQFVIEWTKVIDTDAERIYDMPGYVEAAFSDGTVLLSNRRWSSAETVAAGSELALVRLE